MIVNCSELKRVVNSKFEVGIGDKLKFHLNFMKFLEEQGASNAKSPVFTVHDLMYDNENLWLDLHYPNSMKNYTIWIRTNNEISLLNGTSRLNFYDGKVFIKVDAENKCQ